ATLAESVGVVKRPRPASEVRRPLASGLIRYGANLMDNFRLQVPRNTLSNGLVRISSVNGSAGAKEEGQDWPERMAFSLDALSGELSLDTKRERGRQVAFCSQPSTRSMTLPCQGLLGSPISSATR